MKYNVNNIIVSILLTVLVPSITVSAGTIGPGAGVEIVQKPITIDKKFDRLKNHKEQLELQQKLEEVLEEVLEDLEVRAMALLEEKNLSRADFTYATNATHLKRISAVDYGEDGSLGTVEAEVYLDGWMPSEGTVRIRSFVVSEEKICELIRVGVPAVKNSWRTFGVDESRPATVKDSLDCIENKVLDEEKASADIIDTDSVDIDNEIIKPSSQATLKELMPK